MSSPSAGTGEPVDPTEPLWDLTPVEDWSTLAASLPAAAEGLIRTAESRVKSVRCFDFVPSNYRNAWFCLSRLANLWDTNPNRDSWLQDTAWLRYALAQGSLASMRFCEWGSGWGVVAGLASLAGFEASGIELDAALAEASRQMLREQGLNTTIACGSYFEIDQPADIYYVYGWPSQRAQVLERFLQIAPAHALLLLCDGQDRLRVMTRWPG